VRFFSHCIAWGEVTDVRIPYTRLEYQQPMGRNFTTEREAKGNPRVRAVLNTYYPLDLHYNM